MSFWADFFSFVFPRNLLTESFLGFSMLGRTSRSTFSQLLAGSAVFALNFILLSGVSTGLSFGLSALSLEILHFPLTASLCFGLASLNSFWSKQPGWEGIVPGRSEFLYNSAYLGGAFLILSGNADWLSSAGNALGALVGLLILQVIYWGLRRRWGREDIPRVFEGWPLTLITLGFAGLAFWGFGGIAAWGQGV